MILELWQVSKPGQNKIRASYVRKYIKDDFDNFRNWQLNLGAWKTGISLGKGHGKSWNLKSSKGYEPCVAKGTRA